MMLGQEAPSRKVDYFTHLQPNLRPHMRRIVTDWMLEVCEDQQAGPEVFLLAVHYLDTFLSTTSIRKDQFQLVAATCLLLASKFGSGVPLSAVQLVLYTDHSITLEELVQWELLVLKSLNWELSAITPFALTSHILPLLQLPSSPSTTSLLLHAASSYSATSLPPSLIASAAILTATSLPCLLPHLAAITQHSEENIRRVATFLADLAGLHIEVDKMAEEQEETRPVTPKEIVSVCTSVVSPC